jgi:phosphoglycerate dehydrogenase-like enzyme
MKIVVHYPHPPAIEILEYLRSKLSPDVKVVTDSNQSLSRESQILIAGRPKREQILSNTRLETLIIPWSGLPPETRQLMLDFPSINVHNLHHNAAPVAETTLALLMAAAKQIVPLDRALRAGDWRPRYRPSPALLLDGKTALILGFGTIGRRVAGLCKKLGMEVLATRRNSVTSTVEPADEVHPMSALPVLLARANALIICLPHTPETDALIGESELNLLPPDAVLVNVGRGPIVDEAALYRALRDGRLHAAGLDVWYNYPKDEASRSSTPPSNFPFYELDNVVMSPHRAGDSRESNFLWMDYLAALLNAAVRGEPLPNRVDVRAGY